MFPLGFFILAIEGAICKQKLSNEWRKNVCVSHGKPVAISCIIAPCCQNAKKRETVDDLSHAAAMFAYLNTAFFTLFSIKGTEMKSSQNLMSGPTKKAQINVPIPIGPPVNKPIRANETS